MTHAPSDAQRPVRVATLHRIATWAVTAVVVAVALTVRLVNLDHMPDELYGDIAIVYEYVLAIRQGHWPTYFVLSAGPLYHYLITPFVWMFGLDYFGLKLASVIVSLMVLLAIYALGRELLNHEFGLLATFISAVSSWLLIPSRLGNSKIVVPLLTTLAIYFVVRVARAGRARDAIACAVVASLGLFTYPETFFLPPVIFVTLLGLALTGARVKCQHLLAFVLIVLAFALPFSLIVAKDPANFFSGYIGGKIRVENGLLPALFWNSVHALLAFHVRGDVVFRNNPQSLPHLDVVSGVLFLLGIIFWLEPGRRKMAIALFVPFILLQVPSVLVLRFPTEVPSAARTLGVAPIAYLLVASGLWWLLGHMPKRSSWRIPLLAAALVPIFAINSYRYFQLFIDGLPNHNTSFGRIVAEYIDSLPPKTAVYVVGCCWGDWGQPDPKAIQYVVRTPRQLHFVMDQDATCSWVATASQPAELIWAGTSPLPAPALQQCAAILHPVLHRSPRGEPVFYSSSLDAHAVSQAVVPDTADGATRRSAKP